VARLLARVRLVQELRVLAVLPVRDVLVLSAHLLHLRSVHARIPVPRLQLVRVRVKLVRDVVTEHFAVLSNFVTRHFTYLSLDSFLVSWKIFQRM